MNCENHNNQKQILSVILVVMLPLLTVFQYTICNVISTIRQQLTDSSRNVLSTYCATLESEVSETEEFLLRFAYYTPEFQAATAGRINAPKKAEILSYFEEILDRSKQVTAIVLYNSENDTYTYCSNEISPPSVKSETIIRALCGHLAQGDTPVGWYSLSLGSQFFLARTVRWGNTYISALLSAEQIARNASLLYGINEKIILFNPSAVLNDAEWIEINGISLCFVEKGDCYFSDIFQRYMILQQRCAGQALALVVPYHTGTDSFTWLTELSKDMFNGTLNETGTPRQPEGTAAK